MFLIESVSKAKVCLIFNSTHVRKIGLYELNMNTNEHMFICVISLLELNSTCSAVKPSLPRQIFFAGQQFLFTPPKRSYPMDSIFGIQ